MGCGNSQPVGGRESHRGPQINSAAPKRKRQREDQLHGVGPNGQDAPAERKPKDNAKQKGRSGKGAKGKGKNKKSSPVHRQARKRHSSRGATLNTYQNGTIPPGGVHSPRQEDAQQLQPEAFIAVTHPCSPKAESAGVQLSSPASGRKFFETADDADRRKASTNPSSIRSGRSLKDGQQNSGSKKEKRK